MGYGVISDIKIESSRENQMFSALPLAATPKSEEVC